MINSEVEKLSNRPDCMDPFPRENFSLKTDSWLRISKSKDPKRLTHFITNKMLDNYRALKINKSIKKRSCRKLKKI